MWVFAEVTFHGPNVKSCLLLLNPWDIVDIVDGVGLIQRTKSLWVKGWHPLGCIQFTNAQVPNPGPEEPPVLHIWGFSLLWHTLCNSVSPANYLVSWRSIWSGKTVKCNWTISQDKGENLCTEVLSKSSSNSDDAMYTQHSKLVYC